MYLVVQLPVLEGVLMTVDHKRITAQAGSLGYACRITSNTLEVARAVTDDS
ncbi:uncharacterized protein PHALS_14350 [Plasmopara halstedii]|uniref:Uncharacterized protein n=1 Tax=Plasmopara halstedii TaxID=4781 RepID=A0A0P1ARR1_PLAHL|nr:uncharacterized protein PHALS_14350 [Plasmopara halstedii]CEG44082.1 hypothetical protein PHALS_14350 [Plasmopara halstedii]|eukprot:XP_024580451.1 hypothetical protein PHALS_14350 [Plasmopara halstedii]